MEGKEDSFSKGKDGYSLTYTSLSHLFRTLAYVSAHRMEKGKIFHDPVKRLTFMLDSSRNAVMKVSSLKRLIVLLSSLGYDSIMLYTEDTFEIPSEPFFGYMRGAYTQQEIKEVDSFATHYGLELIPCIETLAHLGCLTQWARFENLFDIKDILLVDDEKTYELIEKMVSSIASSFSSRNINIGMDEAALIGRGKHETIYGPSSPFPLMMRHLKRVLGILDKYGFKAMMWSDMFASLLSPDGAIKSEGIEEIPHNVTLCYWDYYSSEKSHYDAYMKIHRALPNDLAFATACWKWSGYTPQNRFSFRNQKAGIGAAIDNGISRVLVTAWGDNGGECSPFAVLPSIFSASIYRQGKERLDEKLFEVLSKKKLENFLEIDDGNLLYPDIKANTASKEFLLTDPFLSPFDTLVRADSAKKYAEFALRLKKEARGEYAYLFRSQSALCSLLSLKVDLGVRLREHYQKGDRDALKADLLRTKETRIRLDRFILVYEKQWEKENKMEGYEVQSIRLGGVRERLLYAERTLKRYLEGKSEKIEELEIKLIDYYGKETFTKPDDNCEYRSRRLTSVGVND